MLSYASTGRGGELLRLCQQRRCPPTGPPRFELQEAASVVSNELDGIPQRRGGIVTSLKLTADEEPRSDLYHKLAKHGGGGGGGV